MCFLCHGWWEVEDYLHLLLFSYGWEEYGWFRGVGDRLGLREGV